MTCRDGYPKKVRDGGNVAAISGCPIRMGMKATSSATFAGAAVRAFVEPAAVSGAFSQRLQYVVDGGRGGLGESGPLDRDALGFVADLTQLCA